MIRVDFGAINIPLLDGVPGKFFPPPWGKEVLVSISHLMPYCDIDRRLWGEIQPVLRKLHDAAVSTKAFGIMRKMSGAHVGVGRPWMNRPALPRPYRNVPTKNLQNALETARNVSDMPSIYIRNGTHCCFQSLIFKHFPGGPLSRHKSPALLND